MNDEVNYCFDCVDNWNNEECLDNGREIYDDSIACSNFMKREGNDER